MIQLIAQKVRNINVRKVTRRVARDIVTGNLNPDSHYLSDHTIISVAPASRDTRNYTHLISVNISSLPAEGHG